MIRIIVVLCLLLLLSSCSRYHKVQATSSSPSDQSNRQFVCQATTNKKQNESNTCSSSDTIDSDFHRMLLKIQKADGFFAALDQSGGSTPKALREYGIPDNVSMMCFVS